MKLDITRMTSKGQVVIPQEIRIEKNLKEGERFLVYDSDDSIILKRIETWEKVNSTSKLEEVFSKTWKIAKQRGITGKHVEKEISDSRKSL